MLQKNRRKLIESKTDLNKNRFRYFRWTPYTAKVTIMYTCVVPAIVFALGYYTDVS